MNYVGIDLGTTNSVICSYDGVAVKVYKSPEQHFVTPSAIYADHRTKYYGTRAYDRAAFSPDNVAIRFKRLMGSSTPITIRAANLVLSPEECSSEILRYLYSYLPEELRASNETGTVITVPAAFDQTQRDATLAAARMAGIGKVVLMQEPVAAVMAVMQKVGQDQKQDGYFAIYDLGGGTFDVSIAHSANGSVSLLDHGGIAFCGGSDFDRALVDEIVMPWLHQNFALPAAFTVGDKYSTRVRKLAQWAAEKAKIQLSLAPSALISLNEDELRVDDESGRPMYIDLQVERATLENLIRERLDDTVRATQEAIKRVGLTSGDVSRLVFIGGPTQFKSLRDYVCSRIGLPPNTEVDPMTAVAEGAAIFAESIDWRQAKLTKKSTHASVSISAELNFSCEFRARTTEKKATITAKCEDLHLNGEHFQVENLDTGWISGRLKVKNGANCDVQLPHIGDNKFRLLLFASNGSPVSSQQQSVTITRTAAIIDTIPAAHSIGVEVKLTLHGKATKLKHLVSKGDPLPLKRRCTFKAAEKLSVGAPGAVVFKLYEGEIESPVSDNLPIGCIKVRGVDFEAGMIRPGDDLECEYEVAESGRISFRVSVPSIGCTFEKEVYSRSEFGYSDLAIKADAEATAGRIAKIELLVLDKELNRARSLLDQALTASLDPAADPEVMKEASHRLQQARSIVAKVRSNNLPVTRRAELDEAVRLFDQDARTHANPQEVCAFEAKIRTAEGFIGNSSSEFTHVLDEMRETVYAVRWRQDHFIVGNFNWLAGQPHLFPDQKKYAELVDQGSRALDTKDYEELRAVLRRLHSIKASSPWADELLTSNILDSASNAY